MVDVHRLLSVLSTRLGQDYNYHRQIQPWNCAYTGPWNCSTFLAWGLWQVGDRRLLGCRFHKPYAGSKATFPEYWRDSAANPHIWCWTGWFREDLDRYAIRVSENEAVNTPGVIGMYARGEMKDHDNAHIAISLGGNRILEAHGVWNNDTQDYGPGPGVINYRNMRGRFAHWWRLREF